MTDPLAEQMQRFKTVAGEVTERIRTRERLASEIGEQLTEHVERAIAETGAGVEAVDHSETDDTFRFEARLDRAAMVAALTETLPEGFEIAQLNADGSLSIEWVGDGRSGTASDHDAILKAIIGEETETDSDGLIESVPTRDRVLERAAKLGVSNEAARKRLDRLVTLDIIDIDGESVYPDTNFSRL